MNKSVSKNWKTGVHPAKDYKFVGCTVPPEVKALIGLYASSLRVSKSDIMRTILKEWVEENKHARNGWAYETSQRVQSEWNREKHELSSTIKTDAKLAKVFKTYIAGIVSILRKQGLDQMGIDAIISKVKV